MGEAKLMLAIVRRRDRTKCQDEVIRAAAAAATSATDKNIARFASAPSVATRQLRSKLKNRRAPVQVSVRPARSFRLDRVRAWGYRFNKVPVDQVRAWGLPQDVNHRCRKRGRSRRNSNAVLGHRLLRV
jgi:hypothetical protein